MAGIPDGVINVLPGSGSVCGQAISDHPKVSRYIVYCSEKYIILSS